MNRYLVDTNIFLYARGKDHPYRESCRAALRAAGDGQVGLECSVELVQEFAHVLLRREIDRASALQQVDEVRGQCRIHTFDAEVLAQTVTLLREHEPLGVRDAVHLATALHAGITLILSTDRVFDDAPHVQRIDPAAQDAPWATAPNGH